MWCRSLRAEGGGQRATKDNSAEAGGPQRVVREGLKALAIPRRKVARSRSIEPDEFGALEFLNSADRKFPKIEVSNIAYFG